MKVEIHWPDGSQNQGVHGLTKIDSCLSLDADIIEFFDDIIYYSKTYDVIIDNGKVTFVDKE